MTQKIKAIEKGWGEGSIFFTTNPAAKSPYFVDEIQEWWQPVEQKYDPATGKTTEITRLVYAGYKEGKLVFLIESGSGLTIKYE